jgi:hypothetical protein
MGTARKILLVEDEALVRTVGADTLLVTSGDTWPSSDLIPDDGHFLAKPYRIHTLQRGVEKLLDRR